MVGGCRRAFCKGVGNNLAQHRVDERFFRYKLEVYQKNFPNFVYGNPTSTEASNKDEETKVGPNIIT
jgi:hypothetical protein